MGELTAKAAEREADKAAKKAEKEVKKAEKEARKAEREVRRVEKEVRKGEREAGKAGKDTAKNKSIDEKAAQSTGNGKHILVVKKAKRGKKGKGDSGTCEAILDAYHAQQTTAATSNNNGNIANNLITVGQEERRGKDLGIQKAGVTADKDTAVGKSEPHYHNV